MRRAYSSEEGHATAITVPGLIFLVVIAAVRGAVGRAISGEIHEGLIVSIAVGLLGALLGSWLALPLRLQEPFTTAGSLPVLWSIIGAALFVAIIHLISKRALKLETALFRGDFTSADGLRRHDCDVMLTATSLTFAHTAVNLRSAFRSVPSSFPPQTGTTSPLGRP